MELILIAAMIVVGLAVVLLLSQPWPVANKLLLAAALVLATLTLANIAVLPLVAFFTFGTSLLAAMALANVTLYYVLSLPVLLVLHWLTGWPRWLIATATVLSFALLPPLVAQLAYASDIAYRSQGDFDGTLPVAVELVSIQDVRGSGTSCGELCQRLLLEGLATRVRAIAAAAPKGQPLAVSDYTLTASAACTGAVPNGKGCLRAMPVSDSRPDLEVRREAQRATNINRFTGYDIRNTEILTISRNEASQTRTVLKRTMIEASVMTHPMLLAIDGGIEFRFYWGLRRIQMTSKPFVLDNFVLDALSRARGAGTVALPPPRSDTGNYYRGIIVKLLDSDIDGPFPSYARDAVHKWATSRAAWQHEDSSFDLMVRIANDTRFVDVSSVFTTIQKRPDAIRRALPALLERLENPPAFDEETKKRNKPHDSERANISYTLSLLPAADLEPSARRIVDMVEASEESWTAGLIRSLGKLPEDMTLLIRKRLSAANDSVRDAAAVAACTARPAVQIALRADLMGSLETAAKMPNSNERTRPLVRALVRLGEKEQAIALGGGRERLRFALTGPNREELEAGFNPELC